MGKNERTLKHQHIMQNRTKFKSEPTPELPMLDDEPMEIKSSEPTFQPLPEEVPADGEFMDAIELEEKPVKKKRVRKKSVKKKCVKCAAAAQQVEKASKYAASRKGVRLKKSKDPVDEILDGLM